MEDKALTRMLTGLEVLLQMAFFFGLNVFFYFGIMGRPSMEWPICVAMVLPVGLAYLLRRHLYEFRLFVLLHVPLFVAGPILGQNDLQKTFLFLLGAALGGYSIYLKVADNRQQDVMQEFPVSDSFARKQKENKKFRWQISERMPFVGCVVFVIGYMAGYAYKRDIIMNLEVLLFVAFVLLQVLYNDLKKLQLLYIQNHDKAEFPAEQLRRVNGFIIGTTMAFMLVVMLLFYHGEYGSVFHMAGTALLPLVRLILKIFIGVLGAFGGKESPAYEQETTTAADELELEAEDIMETSPIMEAAAEAFGILLIVAAVAGLCYLFYRYAKNFHREKYVSKDRIETVARKENSMRMMPVKTKSQRAKAVKEQENIRKLYKKAVQRGKKDALDVTLSPSELTRETITNESVSSAEITRLYEKARYSDEEIEPQDVQKLKKILTDIRK